PNLLGLTNREEIAEAEFEGFLTAEIVFTEHLNTHTHFNCKYIQDIHKLALGHLYTFAGKYRTVNMSKGGFLFPTARFIPESMQLFENEVLTKLPDEYADKYALIKDVARVHGELLFIHPFREGNGRTARILANLMVRKQGYEGLRFDKINFREYIIAVQRVSEKNYLPMERIIGNLF
ncbi:MAG: cell filamentation protein Fic, partial [Odoribacter splanchnicus]|nr:cell filamentation protein Fic [Odoribacter splanchnicus]